MTIPSRRASLLTARRCGLGALLVLTASGALRADDSQAYVRTLEGSAGFREASVLEERQLVQNAPVLAGDRLVVDRSSRLELEFPDRSRLRADAETELTVLAVAGERDRSAAATEIRLELGRLQFVVPAEFGPAGDPRIDTLNASIYGLATSVFRVETDGRDSTAVVVRLGEVEIVTREGSTRLRAGEAVEIVGADWPRLSAFDAGGEDSLERWAARLDYEAEQAAYDDRYMEPELRYASSRLSSYGGWVDLDGRRGWRPRSVSATWRPFVDGRWVSTPSGLNWVSAEPWGWVTSHYGQWDWVAGYGWVWIPGRSYSPAWVYWYWGQSQVGWVPAGYYGRFYSSQRSWGVGVYGWAGGDAWAFRDWTFCTVTNLLQRRLRDHCRTGWDPSWSGGRADRGLITTDTRPLGRGGWHNPGVGLARLRQSVVPNGGSYGPGGSIAGSAAGSRPKSDGRYLSDNDLPDATDFVARRKQLPAALARRIDTLAPAPHAATRGDTRSDARGDTQVDRPVAGSSAARGAGRAPLDTRQAVPQERPREPFVSARPGTSAAGSARPGSSRSPVVRSAPSSSTPQGATSSRLPGRAPLDTPRDARPDRAREPFVSAGPGGYAGSGNAGTTGGSRPSSSRSPVVRSSPSSGSSATPPDTVRRVFDGLRPRSGVATPTAPQAPSRTYDRGATSGRPVYSPPTAPQAPSRTYDRPAASGRPVYSPAPPSSSARPTAPAGSGSYSRSVPSVGVTPRPSPGSAGSAGATRSDPPPPSRQVSGGSQSSAPRGASAAGNDNRSSRDGQGARPAERQRDSRPPRRGQP